MATAAKYEGWELERLPKSDLIEIVLELQERQRLQKLSKADLVDTVLQLQEKKRAQNATPIAATANININSTAPIAMVAAPSPAAAGIVAPLPVANTNTSDIPSAPPLKIGPPKRYDDEQDKQLQKIKSYIDEQTKISTVSIIEAYFKDIEEAYDFSYCPLFQNVPVGVIHLCYKYCTQFNNYLVFMLNLRHANTPELHILGIKDIQRTNKKTSEQVRKLKADKNVQSANANRHVYTAQLVASPQVLKSLSAESVPLSAIFRVYQTNALYGFNRPVPASNRMDMLYFYSPYFYDYQLDIDNKKKLRYHQYPLPEAPHAELMGNTHSVFHVPFSNQLLSFHPNRTNKQHLVSVFDVYTMQWLTNAENYQCIQLREKDRFSPAMCLYGSQLFLCGGNTSYKEPLNMVETIDCSEIVNLFTSEHDDEEDVDSKESNKLQCRVRSVKMQSEMVYKRRYCDGDRVEVKNQLVVGGGVGDRMETQFTHKTIEFYDLDQDKWMLHQAVTKYANPKSIVWCSGNLVFMTGGVHEQSFYDAPALSTMGCIECIDIRENRKQWQLLDRRNFQKMMNMFNRRDKDSWRVKGLFI